MYPYSKLDKIAESIISDLPGKPFYEGIQKIKIDDPSCEYPFPEKRSNLHSIFVRFRWQNRRDEWSTYEGIKIFKKKFVELVPEAVFYDESLGHVNLDEHPIRVFAEVMFVVYYEQDFVDIPEIIIPPPPTRLQSILARRKKRFSSSA